MRHYHSTQEDLEPEVIAHGLPIGPGLAIVNAAPHLTYDPRRRIDIKAALSLEPLQKGLDPGAVNPGEAAPSDHGRPHEVDAHAQCSRADTARLHDIECSALHERVRPWPPKYHAEE